MDDRRSLNRTWLRRVVKLVVAIACAGSLAYWVWWLPTQVLEHRVARGEIVAEVMGAGTLEARVKTTISPKISGRINEVRVDQGDRVVAGQLLVRLDDEELSQQVEIARANLAAAGAAIDRLKTDKQRTAAILTQAQQHYGRTVKLRQSNAVAESELDQASEALAIAQGGQANSEAAIAEAQKELITAEKTLHYHQARLADTQITAPFDGLIIVRRREPGDVVMPGSDVLTLISTDELWVSAWVDETEMAKLAPGQATRIVFRSEPDRSYRGEVARLGRETDRETREFIVDVSAPELPNNWAVGQRAEVFIETASEDSAVLIPAALIVWKNASEKTSLAAKTPGVFVNDSERARWRPVRLGLRGREMVQVIEGVSEGDRLIAPVADKTTLGEGKRISAR